MTISNLKQQMSSDGNIWGDIGSADLSTLTFTSDNEAVAKVDAAGTITAIGPGSCTIKALLSGIDSKFTKSTIIVVCLQAQNGSGSGNETIAT
jgi:hypothetical protein